MYTFISFASPVTGFNIGCCIIKCDGKDAPKRVKELGLEPSEPMTARAYQLDEDSFKKQGMALNLFYSRDEMVAMEFERDDSQD